MRRNLAKKTIVLAIKDDSLETTETIFARMNSVLAAKDDPLMTKKIFSREILSISRNLANISRDLARIS